MQSTLTKGNITATPNANTTLAQTSTAVSNSWTPVNNSPINVDTLGQKPPAPIAVPLPAPYNPPTHNVSAPAGTTPSDNGMATIPNSSATDTLKGLITKLGTASDVKNQLETENNTDQLLKQKTADYNSYQQAKIDQTNTIENMRKEAGGTLGGNQEAITDYQRSSDAHLSNLAIQSSISSGNYTQAEDSITSKVNAMFSPIKDQISTLSTLANMTNNDMTDSEKLAATTKANALEKDSTAVQTAAHDIQQTLLKNGNYSTVAPKIDKINQDYVNGKITATEAQSQMYSIASPYGVANLGGEGGIAGSNLPQVAMTADNIPDPKGQANFLASLPPDIGTLVKGLSDYSINPSTFATRLLKGAPGMTRADAISLAKQYDPSYSESQYATRQALQTNFAQGKYSQNINSLNTAVGHLADIPANFAKLNNIGFTPANYIKNGIANTFGSGAVTSAGTNINASVGELASTFKSGGATDTEIKNLGSVNTNSSPAQAKAFVQTSVDLLASRLNALTDTYTSGMGRAPLSNFLSPTNIKTLSDLKNQGFDVKIKGVYYTDPIAYTKADSANATALSTVREQYPTLTPAQATQYAQYLQENGQI